jgi:tetratricopeptide (TPR) repeat protein
MRLNPHYSYFFEEILGPTYFHLEDYDEAAEMLQRAVERNPQFLFARQYLVATYGRMGRIEDAEWEAEEVLTLESDFSVPAEREAAPYRNPGDLEFYLEGLRLAGLPV